MSWVKLVDLRSGMVATCYDAHLSFYDNRSALRVGTG
jgi:hypothetical protein